MAAEVYGKLTSGLLRMMKSREYPDTFVPPFYSWNYRASLTLMILLMLAGFATLYCEYTRIKPALDPANYYAMLGDAFLSGQTYLKEAPSPDLLKLTDPYEPNAVARQNMLWDASLYNGKYYLYFGPTPGLVWAAAQAITGISLSDPELVIGFSFLGTACLCFLLLSIALRNGMARRLWLMAPVIALGFGTWLPFMLRRPSFYEVAVSGAYGFSALGFLLLWHGLISCKNHWLFLASVCFGLAVGCRVPHLFNGVALLLAWLLLCRKGPSPKATFACLLGPWAFCLASLAVYNYVRFGNPFETGVHYQLTFYNSHRMTFAMMQWARLVPNAYYYLMRPLLWAHPVAFPFFQMNYHESVFLPGHILVGTMEPIYGLLPNCPFVLWIFAAHYCWIKRPRLEAETRVITYSILLYGLGMLGMLLFFFYTTARYGVDFAPWLMFFASVQYLQLLRLAKSRKGLAIVLALGILTACYSAFTGSMSGYCGQYLCDPNSQG